MLIYNYIFKYSSKKRKATECPFLPLVHHLENNKFSKSTFNLTLNESYRSHLSEMYKYYISLTKLIPNSPKNLNPSTLIKCILKGLSRCITLFGIPTEPNLYFIPDFNIESLNEHIVELTSLLKNATKFEVASGIILCILIFNLENFLIFSKYLFRFNSFFNTVTTLESVTGASLLSLLKAILKGFYMSKFGAQLVLRITFLISTLKSNELTRKHIYTFIASHSKFSEMILLEGSSVVEDHFDLLIYNGTEIFNFTFYLLDTIISNSVKLHLNSPSVRITYFLILNKLLEEDLSLIESGLWDAIRVCYRGSNSEFDKCLLSILQKFELSGFPVFSSSFAYGNVNFAFRYMRGLDFVEWSSRFSLPLNSKWLEVFFEKPKLKF